MNWGWKQKVMQGSWLEKNGENVYVLTRKDYHSLDLVAGKIWIHIGWMDCTASRMMKADGIHGCVRARLPRNPGSPHTGRAEVSDLKTSHIWKAGFNTVLRGAGRGTLAYLHQGSSYISDTMATARALRVRSSAGATETLDIQGCPSLDTQPGRKPPLLPPAPTFSWDNVLALSMPLGAP